MNITPNYCYGLRETTVCTQARFSNVSSVPLIFPSLRDLITLLAIILWRSLKN